MAEVYEYVCRPSSVEFEAWYQFKGKFEVEPWHRILEKDIRYTFAEIKTKVVKQTS